MAEFFDRWMQYIRDDVKLTQLVIPGAHNAGSYGMKRMAECQKDTLLTQFRFGIRQFCIRLNTNRRSDIVLAHGISKGDLFENVLKDLRTIITYCPEEILILDVREYYDQKIGPITLHYHVDKAEMDRLLEAYIQPEKYAYCDFDDISEVTLGDIRKAGKRYIIVNENEEYRYSKNCECALPWDKEIFGSKAPVFCERATELFDRVETQGLLWFQTQQTPNLGTEIGLTPPVKLDAEVRKYFYKIMDSIATHPEYLSRANIIAGDFMTYDDMKSKAILKLNLLKGNVREDKIEEYEKAVV